MSRQLLPCLDIVWGPALAAERGTFLNRPKLFIDVIEASQERLREMHPIKPSSLPLVAEAEKGSAAPNQNSRDRAAEAGLSKVDFYKTDKWEEGYDIKSVHVVPKNTIPLAFRKAFAPSGKPDPVTDKPTYDRNLFVIDEYPYFTHPEKKFGGAQISLQETGRAVADVWFDTDTFVIRLLPPPETGTYPFHADALLKAIHRAKWQTELYCLPEETVRP